MRKEILIITVAAFALNSCGIYTNYKPATEVPEDLYGEEAAVTDSTDNLANLGWRDVFTDPHLRQLIEQGLQSNTDLQSAQWRVISIKGNGKRRFIRRRQAACSRETGCKRRQVKSAPCSNGQD